MRFEDFVEIEHVSLSWSHFDSFSLISQYFWLGEGVYPRDDGFL